MTVGAGVAAADAGAAADVGAAPAAAPADVAGALVGAEAGVEGAGLLHAAMSSPAPVPIATWINVRLLTAPSPLCIALRYIAFVQLGKILADGVGGGVWLAQRSTPARPEATLPNAISSELSSSVMPGISLGPHALQRCLHCAGVASTGPTALGAHRRVRRSLRRPRASRMG